MRVAFANSCCSLDVSASIATVQVSTGSAIVNFTFDSPWLMLVRIGLHQPAEFRTGWWINPCRTVERTNCGCQLLWRHGPECGRWKPQQTEPSGHHVVPRKGS